MPTAVGVALDSSNMNIVADYSKKFWKVQPQSFPSCSYALVKNGAEMTDLVQRWAKKAPLPTFCTVDHSGGYNIGSTSFVVDASTFGGLRVGAKLYAPRTGQVIKVTSLTAATYTVGCAAITAALSDYEVLVIGPTPTDESMAYAHMPSPLMHDPTAFYNEMISIWEPIKVSNRTLPLIKRGRLKWGETLADKQADAMELVKLAMEMNLNYGQRSSSPGTDGVNTESGGLIWHAVTNGTGDNYVAAAGDISKNKTFEDLVKGVCRYASRPTMKLQASPIAHQAIQRLYQGGALGYYGDSIIDEVGISVDRVHTPWGTTLEVYLNWLFTDYVAADGVTPLGQMIVWQPDFVKWHPNQPIGKYSVPPTSADWTEVILAEGSWELGPPESILFASGITKVAA